jgi:hypothetical protein
LKDKEERPVILAPSEDPVLRRIVSAGARAGLAVTLLLLAQAALRLPPVFAQPLVPLRVRPLALLALLLGVVAGLCAVPRPRRAWRPLAWGLALALLALAGLVALRPAAGLAPLVSAAGAPPASLRPGPIDLIGADLEELPRARRTRVQWRGELHAPRGGTYRLWVSGRGRVELRLDGVTALRADAESLQAQAALPISEGAHALEVDYERVGPGPRLRVGWSAPRAGPFPARDEPIPPRRLGAPLARAWWFLTDALVLAIAALLALLSLRVPWDAPRPLPSGRPVSRLELGGAACGLLLVLAAMSWPLVRDLAGQGVFDRPDGRLNAWILAWVAHAALRAPAQLFQAPIFHPLPDALAFSENLLLPGVASLPLQLLGGPALAYNVVLLLGDALSGLGVYLLARRVSGDRLAAFAGAAFFAAGIHRWVNMAHLHAQLTPCLPFALLALDRFRERPTLRRALGVASLLALQAAASIYVGAITALLLVVAVGLLALAGRLRPGDAARLLAAALVAALALLPLARPYLRMRAFQGEEFPLATVAAYAATPESYAASAGPLYETLARRHLDPERVRDPLFPGALPIALGLAGLAVAPRRYAWLAVVGSLLAVLISLGPATALYRLLHEHVLLFRGLRALARFSIVPVLALSVLLALALAGQRWLRLLALPLLLAEACVAPIRYARAATPSAASRSLAGGKGAVAWLPLGEGDTAAMLDGLAHLRPLVNGDSGFVPRPYARAMELLDDRFGPDALRLLRALDVTRLLSSAPLAGLGEPTRFGETLVYELPAGEPARAAAPARSRAALWGPAGARVDLGAVEQVGRVVFEPADGPWLEEPRMLLSTDGRSWREVRARASLADATLALYQDPRGGRAELRFEPQAARFLRLDPRLPARPGAIGVDR